MMKIEGFSQEPSEAIKLALYIRKRYLEYKGNIEGIGKLYIDKNGDISLCLVDDKYYVYYGITKDLDNYEKIAGNMKELGYDNYREEIVVSSKSFLETLEQYDMLLRETTDNSIVNAICNQVLTSYEELVLNGSED